MSAELEYTTAIPPGHVVKFYVDDADLTASVRRQVITSAGNGAAAIFIATQPHLQAFRAELEAAGVDPESASREGRLYLLDAAETLSQFTSRNKIDVTGFRRVIGGVVERASRTGRPVIAFGEMVALLWDGGDVLAAIELERLWNELAEEYEFFLLCGYKQTSIAGDHHAGAVHEICALHSEVEPVAAQESEALEAVCEFPEDPAAPSEARRFIAEVLDGWGHQSALIHDAKLVVSELSTNAVVHARSAFRLEARVTASGIRLAVHDASPVTLGPRDTAGRGDSGHGLNLVAALASRWGVELDSSGKTVWAELPAPAG